jgi:hypothetical protein
MSRSTWGPVQFAVPAGEGLPISVIEIINAKMINAKINEGRFMDSAERVTGDPEG